MQPPACCPSSSGPLIRCRPSLSTQLFQLLPQVTRWALTGLQLLLQPGELSLAALSCGLLLGLQLGSDCSGHVLQWQPALPEQ